MIIVPCEVGFGKKMYSLHALIDTGATTTVISESFVKSKGWKTINTGKKAFTSANVVDIIELSRLQIKLGDFLFKNRKVSLGNCDYVPFDLCIGMDIISQGDLSLKTSSGSTVLTFSIPEDS